MGAPGRAYKTRHPKKQRFLVEYAVSGNISRAAIAAGVRRPTIYLWQEHDNAFALSMREAEIEATESLEAEARRRGAEGTEKPVYQGGVCVGHIREYSDTLLIFLLKGLKPEKYRERETIDHRGAIRIDHAAITDEDRAARIDAVFEQARARRAGSASSGGNSAPESP